MILIVGLGNPGRKFQNTRHNTGFRVLDEFAKKNNFPEFKLSKKFNTLISENVFSNKKIILAKPQTFMNNSGKSLKILNTKYKIQNTNLWVIHDDIDLPLSKIKIVKNRGSAGHKGVESIIKEIGTKNFVRFRVGIKKRQNAKGERQKPDKFVLEKFTKKEGKIIKEVIKTTVEAIEVAVIEGLQIAMTKFNK